MFKNLIDKIGESTLTALAEAGISPSKSHTSTPIKKDPFSIDDSGDVEGASTPSHLKSGFSSVDLSVPDMLSPKTSQSRRSSASSVLSDTSSIRPGSSFYPLASDLESASELDDSVGYLPSGTEQLRDALRKSQQGYHKYKGRYSDLARHYREMERENAKTKKVLTEFQDRALRREAELKEQCLLEQRAKAHLEEILRNDLEEKDHLIATLNTKVHLLKSQVDTSIDGNIIDLNTKPVENVESSPQIEELVTALNLAHEEITLLQSRESDLKIVCSQTEYLQSQLQERDEQIKKLTQLIEETGTTQATTSLDHDSKGPDNKELVLNEGINLQNNNSATILQQSLPGNQNNSLIIAQKGDSYKTESDAFVSIEESTQNSSDNTQDKTQYINALNFDSNLDVASLMLGVDSLTVIKGTQLTQTFVDKPKVTRDASPVGPSDDEISSTIEDFESEMDNIIALLSTDLMPDDRERVVERWKRWKNNSLKHGSKNNEFVDKTREVVQKLKSLLLMTSKEGEHSLPIGETSDIFKSSFPKEQFKSCGTATDEMPCQSLLLQKVETGTEFNKDSSDSVGFANFNVRPEILEQRYKYCVWLQQKFEALHNEKSHVNLQKEFQGMNCDRSLLINKVKMLEEQVSSYKSLEGVITSNKNLEQKLNRNKELEADIETAKTIQDMLLADIKTAGTSNEALQEELHQAQIESKSFSEKLEKLKENNKLSSHELDIATSCCSDIQIEIEEVIRCTHVLKTEYEKMMEEKEKLVICLEEGTKYNEDLTNDLEVMNNKQQVLKDKIQNMQDIKDLLLNHVEEEKKLGEHLEEKISVLQKYNDGLKEELEKLQATNTSLSYEHDGERNVNGHLKEELQGIQEGNKILRKDIEELQTMKITLCSDLDQEKEASDHLKEELHEIKNNNEILKEDIEKVQATNTSLCNARDKEHKTNSNLKEELQEIENTKKLVMEGIENLETMKASLSSKFEEEKRTSIRLQEELQEMQNSNAVLMEDLELMQTMKDSLSKEIDQGKEVNCLLNGELQDLQKRNGLLKEDITNMETMKTLLSDKLDDEKKVSSHLKEELQEIQKSNVLLKEEVKKLESEKTSISIELDDERKATSHLKEDLQNLQRINDRLKEEVKRALAERTALSNELDAEKKYSNHLQEELSIVQKRSERLKEENDRLHIEKNALCKELDEARSIIRQLKENLQEMQKVNECLREEVSKIQKVKLSLSNELDDEKKASKNLKEELQEMQKINDVLKGDVEKLKSVKASLSEELEDEKNGKGHLKEELSQMGQRNKKLLEDLKKMEETNDLLSRDLNEEKNLSSHRMKELHQMTENVELLKGDLEKLQELKAEREKDLEIDTGLKESKVPVSESMMHHHDVDMWPLQDLASENTNLKEQVEALKTQVRMLESKLQEDKEMHALQIKDLTRQFEVHLEDWKSEHELEMGALREDDETNLSNFKTQLKFYKTAAVKGEKKMQEDREYFEERIKENEESNSLLQEQLVTAAGKHETEMREAMTKWRQHSNKEIDLLKASHQEEVSALMHEWQCERKSRGGNDASSSGSEKELENTNRVAVAAVESSTNTLEMLQREFVSQKSKMEDLKKHKSEGSACCLAEETPKDFTREYLRNVLYEFLMGSASHDVLVKVLADLVQFDPEQTRNVLEKFEQKQSLLTQLGLL